MYYKLVACAENVNANYKFIGSPQNSNIINKLNKKSFSTTTPFRGGGTAHAAGTKTSINQSLLDDRIFNEWLSGVIDGVGNFNLTKKGIARLTIILNIRDKKVLFDIRHKFGGSIHTIANNNAVKYQLSHKKGLIALLESVNGLIRNPSKLLQMNKLCVKYNIVLINPKPLTFNNGWLSGLIDSEGLVDFNEVSGQVFISINQKNKYLLDPLVYLYGGRIKMSLKTEVFVYIIYRKIELFKLIDNYFIKYPLRTKKFHRINLIKEYYLKKISSNNQDVIKLNEWVKFKEKWDKFKVSNSYTFNLKESNGKLGKVLFPLKTKTGLIKSSCLFEGRTTQFVGSINENSLTSGVRYYSTSLSEKVNFYDENFLEWFRGFVDGEGTFGIRPLHVNAFKFSFKLGLHVDDANVLYFICQSLGFGKVWVGKSYGVFKAESLSDVRKLIDIFKDRPLNTTKHLNFLDFKKAYELYTSNIGDKKEAKQKIDNIIISMNSKRSMFVLPDNFKFKISSYWPALLWRAVQHAATAAAQDVRIYFFYFNKKNRRRGGGKFLYK
jgi:hypothetical protein